MNRYPLAASVDEAFSRWNLARQRQEKPTEAMERLLSATQRALDAGLSYSSEVLQFVIKDFAADLTDEDIQAGRGEVEGGILGCEVYSARKVIEARKWQERVAEARDSLALSVGSELGVLIFNDFKMNTSCKVTALTDSTVSIEGKRGRYGVTLTTDFPAIIRAMERAVEKGKRKSATVAA